MFMISRLPAVLWRSGVFFALSLAIAWGGEGESIFRWTSIFQKSVRQDSTPPGQVSRRLAILYLAAHDAHDLGEKSFFASAPKPEKFAVDGEAAAMGALAAGAQILYPSHRAAYQEDLKQFKEKRREAGVSKQILQVSLSYGRSLVYAYIKEREGDGASSKLTFIPSDKVGQWRRTPPRYRPPELNHWGTVRPFLLKSPDQFRAPPPPKLDSKAYQDAVKEVMKLGGQKTSKESEETAQFWSCFSYTSTPSGHWNTILISLLRQEKEVKLARVLDAFAILNVALADTAIACWDTKYHYRFWRPENAIRHSHDIHWKPLLESPPHPEYVSGHSSFAGAGSQMMQFLFKKDECFFEATSDSVPDVVRKYEKFSNCAKEMGWSRILGGIHFSFSDQEGQKLGQSVAKYCWQIFNKKK